MIRGIAHVAFTVIDMEKSLEFYCGKLGFKKAFELNRPDGEPWIVYIMVSPGQFVELFYGGTEKTESSAGYSHLCFEVDDVQETAEELKSKGVVLDSGPNQGSDTNWQCWIRDPDGNRIEMMQINPLSPQMAAQQ
ncbi:MAG: VOC family protein [Eubacteriales bacterium]|nr:VOC family protein [Eubacteriales bacterium]